MIRRSFNKKSDRKFNRSDLESLVYVKTLMKRCEQVQASETESQELAYSALRNRLHQMEYYEFSSSSLIHKSKLLDDEGLPSIFSTDGYPWDIRADSLMLHKKWSSDNLDSHLLRGIECRKSKRSEKKSTSWRLTRKLESINSNYTGEGQLINGQWWPLLVCAMRDGAHGEVEAGIHGQNEQGAYSVVVSGGGYCDIDDGDIIRYCGTSGKQGTISRGTAHLKKTFELKNPIRVLRSSALPKENAFRPVKGIRYDGLYQIVEDELLDSETVMYRFVLKRYEGQDPIRCTGVEARPTGEELAAWAKIRGLLGLSG